MKFEFTTDELRALLCFAAGRGVCFDNNDEHLLEKLQNYISQAEALEVAEGI